jgi:UDP-2,3-diacylglucosamine pyrophosphatase LpxH
VQIWTDAVDQRLKELRKTYSQKQTAARLSHEFGYTFTRNAVKNREKTLTSQPIKVDTPYKETIEIFSDGSHKSDKLLTMSAEQAKDVNYLLQAHGFDVHAWELVSAKNNIWNVYSKEDKVQTLYSSKITVKPKVNGIDWDKLIQKLQTLPSITIDPEPIKHEDVFLSLPLFDMHFGPSNYENYKHVQMSILQRLENNYKEVLIIIGQDLLHNDDFRGRTASGREIGKVDMVKAWHDAARFYEPIIQLAIRKSKVKIMYSKGNHDESMSWAFVQYIKGKYPQAEYDDSFKERKVHMLGLNFIGVHHGDKKKEINLPENFSTEFPMEWSIAKTREIFTGHLHHERVIDKGGTVIRRMPTGNEIDDYHDDMGYTTAHKRFQIFEYTVDAVKSIHYV